MCSSHRGRAPRQTPGSAGWCSESDPAVTTCSGQVTQGKCARLAGMCWDSHGSHLTSPREKAWSLTGEGLPARGRSALDKVPHLLGWQRTAGGPSTPAQLLAFPGRAGREPQRAWHTAGALFKRQLIQPWLTVNTAHWAGGKASHKLTEHRHSSPGGPARSPSSTLSSRQSNRAPVMPEPRLSPAWTTGSQGLTQLSSSQGLAPEPAVSASAARNARSQGALRPPTSENERGCALFPQALQGTLQHPKREDEDLTYTEHVGNHSRRDKALLFVLPGDGHVPLESLL